MATQEEIEPFSPDTVKRLKQLVLAALIVALVAAIPLAYVWGERKGREAIRQEVFRQQATVIEEILASDEQRYGGLRIEESPNLWFEIKGDVPTGADRDVLARQLEKEFGSEMTSKLIRLVGMENFF